MFLFQLFQIKIPQRLQPCGIKAEFIGKVRLVARVAPQNFVDGSCAHRLADALDGQQQIALGGGLIRQEALNDFAAVDIGQHIIGQRVRAGDAQRQQDQHGPDTCAVLAAGAVEQHRHAAALQQGKQRVVGRIAERHLPVQSAEPLKIVHRAAHTALKGFLFLPQALDADFFVFSGHKIFGPTGIGVVYGKQALLEQMPPWQGGGNMIADVTFEKTVYQGAPAKFEAGTGNIADAVGLGAAIDYVNSLGIENIARYEHDLLVYGMQQLGAIRGVRLIGTAAHKASVMSFVLAGYTTEEVGKALNEEGIAVRTGHHCCQPLMCALGTTGTTRASFALYNTEEEVQTFLKSMNRALDMLS